MGWVRRSRGQRLGSNFAAPQKQGTGPNAKTLVFRP